MQYELRRGLLLDLGYVGSRGVGLLGKINLAVPVDPRVTPVNGFTDIYDRLGRVINPDFFVPAEFLGLNRNGGFQQLTNIGRSTYHSLQSKVRAQARPHADDQRRLHAEPIDGHAVVRRRPRRARSHGGRRTTSARPTTTARTG